MSDDPQVDKGFALGVAWGIALQHHYNLGADQMLHESGMAYEDFKRAGVPEADLKVLRKLFKSLKR